MSNVYVDNGYKNRDDYLECLSVDFDIDLEDVYCMADMLGPTEDFDGLVTHLGDYFDSHY